MKHTLTIHGMQPRHVALILFALYVLLSLCGCAYQGQTAKRLQGNLSSAKTASGEVGKNVTSAQGALSRADYKILRAKKLLDQIEKPM